MPQIEALWFRLATPSDAESVAALHADSWRRNYRGAYSDAFLDGDLDADRLAVWRSRFSDPDASTHTLIAEDAVGLVGFAHTVFDADPTWGALLDNLHVTHERKRRRVGSQLMALTARAVLERSTGLYLWVLEQNVSAQAFYAANGGNIFERAPASAPGGNPASLNGSPFKLRCAWADPAAIVEPA